MVNLLGELLSNSHAWNAYGRPKRQMCEGAEWGWNKGTGEKIMVRM